MKKKDLRSLIAQRDKYFKEGSSLLEDLPIRIITIQISLGKTKKLSEHTNEAQDVWG